MRLGIIGAGTIGKTHAIAAQSAGIEIGWITDLNENLAKKLANDVSSARYTTDLRNVLDDKSVNAVVIAVPNSYHKDLAVAAMDAGKDVLLEKPMGINQDECLLINATAEKTQRVLQIGMANRFSAVGQAAKVVAESGELGAIYHVKANLYLRRGIPGLGSWFTTKAIAGGGVLIDNGVHLVDLALWLLNFPVVTRVSGRVYSGFGSPIKDYVFENMWAGPPRLDGICDVEESAHALIHFGEHGTIELNIAWAINMPKSMEGSLVGLFGHRGGLTFELYGDHLKLASERYGRNVETRVNLPVVDGFKDQMQAFERSVTTREAPLATGWQGQRTQAVLDAIYESHESNSEVALRD
jgi:predicted dehydrogenase